MAREMGGRLSPLEIPHHLALVPDCFQDHHYSFSLGKFFQQMEQVAEGWELGVSEPVDSGLRLLPSH